MIKTFATDYDDHDHGYGGGYNDDGDDDDDDDDDGDDDLLWWLAVQVLLLRRILTPFRVPLFTCGRSCALAPRAARVFQDTRLHLPCE